MIILTKKSNPFYVEFPSCAMNFIIFLEIILIYTKGREPPLNGYMVEGVWVGS
jgi:hypothetical protein